MLKFENSMSQTNASIGKVRLHIILIIIFDVWNRVLPMLKKNE